MKKVLGIFMLFAGFESSIAGVTGSYWSATSSIRLEYVVVGGHKTSIETAIGKTIRGAMNRWLSNLDPMIGGIADIASTEWVSPDDPYNGATIRVDVDLTMHDQQYTTSCNPNNPTNYCLVSLHDAVDASGAHLLNNPIYLNNVLQAAFGVVLGLSADDPSSAVYDHADWTTKYRFPSVGDIAWIQQIYSSHTNAYLPLIRLKYAQSSPGVFAYRYVLGWPAASERTSGLIGVDYLGRNPSSTHPDEETACLTCASYQRYEYYYSASASSYEVLIGNQETEDGTNTSGCPQVALDQKKQFQVGKSSNTDPLPGYWLFPLGLLFQFPSSGIGIIDKPLVCYWDGAGHWVVTSGMVLSNCQYRLGYIGR